MLDSSLTPAFIRLHTGKDLENEDPEESYYHPASVLSEILGLANKLYRKHSGEVESIISAITKATYVDFYNNGCCCRSLSEFMQRLLFPEEVDGTLNTD